MNEDIVKSLNLEMTEIIRRKEKPEEKLKALEELKDRMNLLLDKHVEQKNRMMASVYEVTGNMYMQMKKPAEAEKQYREMLNTGAALYQTNPGQYDLLYAQTNLRIGTFYKDLLKITEVLPQPFKLNENQQKVFDLCDKMFRNAVKLSVEKIKQGNQAAVELQGKCMNNLMVLKGSVGAYEEAIAIGEQLIRIGKALFQVTDDGPHALELSQWMGTLAIIYLLNKDYVKSMETLEDCVYVLEDKEDTSPLVFGIRMASSFMNLGNACALIPEEAYQAEGYYKKGIEKFEAMNEKSEGKLENEKRQAYIMLAAYYKKEGREEEAKKYRKKAGVEK